MALSHTLAIEIDDESLQALAAAQMRVAVAKQGTTGIPNIVWLALDLAPVITVRWSESYGLYAASAALSGDRILRVRAEQHPAIDRSVYSFRNDRFDEAVPDPGILPSHYDVRNASGQAATFGLLQAAIVNGGWVRAPVNAAVVPAGFTADFAPPTTLRVWALRDVEGGSVATVPPDASTVFYNAGPTAILLRYDLGEKTFTAEAD
jgi:hypothetical protein